MTLGTQDLAIKNSSYTPSDPLSLHDFAAQERYYAEIVRRHRALVGWDVSDEVNVEVRLGSLSLEEERKSQQTAAGSDAELATIFMAMRKLREAIIATARADDFAPRAYMFIIHAAIMARDFEAYHPAVLYMLYRMHRLQALEQSRLRELVNLHVLDLACRQRDFAAAHAAMYRFGCTDRTVIRVVDALVHDNWPAFWSVQNSASKYHKYMIQWADDAVRRHALNAIGRGYFTVDSLYLEKSIGMSWFEAKKCFKLSWETEGEMIIIKRVKAR